MPAVNTEFAQLFVTVTVGAGGVELTCVIIPLRVLQASVVHGLLSFMLTAVWKTPETGSQPSVVHALPSLTFTGVWNTPVAGIQPSVVHTLLSSVFIAV